MTTYTIPTVEEVHTLTPVINDLPGAAVPYALSSGEGHRYAVGDTLVTVLARPQDTGGEFAAAWFTGKRGASERFHSTPGSTFIQIFDGQLRVWLPEEMQVLIPGDSVSIPPNIPWAWQMEAHVNRFLAYSTSGAAVGFASQVGKATTNHIFDNSTSAEKDESARSAAAEQWGVRFHDLAYHAKPAQTGDDLPDGPQPFIVKAGGGDRWEGMNQLNAYVTRNKNTAEKFFAIATRCGFVPYFPRHFHRRHTENFLCVDGRVRMYINGEEILMTRGDFVHAPAGTIHTFQVEAHNSQLLGLLTPGIFEPFFEYINTPTDNRVHTEGAFEMPFDGMARAQQDLDLVVTGPPPGR